MTRLRSGRRAPAFEVDLPDKRTLTLESFAHRPLVLVFLRHLA